LLILSAGAESVFYAKDIPLANLKGLFSGALNRITHFAMWGKLKASLHRSHHGSILTRINHLSDLLEPPAGLRHAAAFALRDDANGVAVEFQLHLFI
jgi:hypothetical protein